MIRQQPVSPGTLDGRRQSPWAGNPDLQDAIKVLEQLLRIIQVTAPLRPSAQLVGPRCAGETPSGWLHIETQAIDDPHRPSDHPGRKAPVRQLGQWQHLAKHISHRAQGPTEVLSGERPCGSDVHQAASLIVAEPTTRVSSKNTIDCPGATPRAGSSRFTTTCPVSVVIVAGNADP